MIKTLLLSVFLNFSTISSGGEQLASLIYQKQVVPVVNRCQIDEFTFETYNGTATKFGTAWITAYHVVRDCESLKPTRISKDLDLAILKEGKVSKCQKAIVGEKVSYQGYPAYRGKEYFAEYERTEGVVLELNKPVYSYDTGERVLAHSSMDKGSNTREIGEVFPLRGVRSGYSGGRVFNSIGTIGMISSANPESILWTSATDICDFINEKPFEYSWYNWWEQYRVINLWKG